MAIDPQDPDFDPEDPEEDGKPSSEDDEAAQAKDSSEADIDAELRRLQQRADENRKAGKQLGLGLPDEEAAGEDLAGEDLLRDLQNPEEAHSLYYAIRRELMNGLPAGGENKELRQFVYDEKNLYLNRGKEIDPDTGIRGSDGRQAYLQHLQNALIAVRRWSAQGGNAFDAFMMFRDMNKQAGFRPSGASGAAAEDAGGA